MLGGAEAARKMLQDLGVEDEKILLDDFGG